MDEDDIVGIVTQYGLEDAGIEIRWLRDFSNQF